MKRFRNPFLRMILLLLPCGVLVFSVGASESAVLERFCQYPPYVVQTVAMSIATRRLRGLDCIMTQLLSSRPAQGPHTSGQPPARARRAHAAAPCCR